MRIILTGSTGFVGTNLIKYFKKYNIEIISVYRNNFESFLSKHIFIKDDIILHLAGLAHDTNNVLDPKKYYLVNTELTIKLFDVYLNSKASNFIFLSSIKAVADESTELIDELYLPTPTTPYGRSKKLAEDYINENGNKSNKKYIILRPTMIHGPGNKGNLNSLNNLIKMRIPWLLGSFENKRSLCSIDNLLFILKKLIYNIHIPSGTYNICDDLPLSTNEMVKILATSNNTKIKILKINRNVIIFIAKVGDIFNFSFNSEKLEKLTENFIVSNKKIKNTIGYDLPISSKDGLLKTANSFNQ